MEKITERIIIIAAIRCMLFFNVSNIAGVFSVVDFFLNKKKHSFFIMFI